MKMDIKKFAMVGASALVIAMYSGTASAQVSFEAGIPQTLDITAEVDNTIVATITDPDMGVWGVIRSNVAGEQATLSLGFADNQVGSADGAADAVEGGSATTGVVAITGAFPNTPITVALSAPTDLVCALCAVSSPVLDLYRIEADLLNVAPNGVNGTSNSVIDLVTPANNYTSTATTTGAGVLTFDIGAMAQTTVGADPYETGLYEGTYDMILEY